MTKYPLLRLFIKQLPECLLAIFAGAEGLALLLMAEWHFLFRHDSEAIRELVGGIVIWITAALAICVMIWIDRAIAKLGRS